MQLYHHTETDAYLVQETRSGDYLVTAKDCGKSVFMQGDDASRIDWMLSAYTDVMV